MSSVDWKQVDPETTGNTAQYGSTDGLAKWFKYITGVANVGTVDINSIFRIRNGMLELRDPSNSNSLKFNVPTLASGNVTLNYPVDVANGQEIVTNSGQQQLTQKIIDFNNNSCLNFPTSSGGGGGGTSGVTVPILAFTWFIYIDPANGNYVALKYDGTKITNTTHDIGALITSVLDASTAIVNLYILVGAGKFEALTQIASASLRRSHYAIIGLGMGVTIFHLDNNFNGTFMDLSGVGTGSIINLSADCNTGDRSINVTDASSFVGADYISLRSTAVWGDSPSARGEINRVMTKSGNTIYLNKYSRDDYTTAAAASIRKLNMIVDVHVKDFAIEANANSLVNEPGFIRLILADQCSIRNVRVRNPIGDFHKGMIVYSITNCIIEGCHFVMDPDQVYMQHTMTGGSYALSMRSACESVLIKDCYWLGCWRHGFTTTGSSETDKQGIPRDILIVNPVGEATGECWMDTHDEGDNIIVIGGMYNGTRARTTGGGDDTDAYNSRSPRTYFKGCSSFNCTGAAFSFSNDHCGVKECEVHNQMFPAGGTKGWAISVDSINECEIDGLTVDGCDGHVIHLDTCNDISINRLVARNGARASGQTDIIYMTNCTNIDVLNSKIKCSGKKPIVMQGSSTGLFAVGNNFNGSSSSTLIGANTLGTNRNL